MIKHVSCYPHGSRMLSTKLLDKDGPHKTKNPLSILNYSSNTAEIIPPSHTGRSPQGAFRHLEQKEGSWITKERTSVVVECLTRLKRRIQV